VLQIGEPQEIYERPASKYVADFIGETNFIDGVVKAQNGSTVEVELEGTGVVCVESSRSFANGQQVSVAVRPEKLRLNTELANGNNLKGRVEEVIYIGTDTHYGIRFAGGQKVRVREQNILHGHHEIIQIGEEASVSFAYSSPRLLTE
jgi:spermidine/putrescine transport system ATP-binding protein